LFKHVLAIALVSVLCLLPSTTRAVAAPNSAAAPLVTAFVQHGWVFAVRSDGSTIRLTAGTNATSAVLSPDRSTVAYFTAVRNRTDRYGRPYLSDVWTVGTRANPQHLVANLDGAAAGALAWSPNGRSLAYLYGRELAVWRGPGTGAPIITRLSRLPALDSEPTLAWSPDSRQIAVPLPPVSLQLLPRDLSVAIMDVPAGPSKVVRVSFSEKLLGSRTTALGSHPASSQIGWSAGSLLVATAINGAGNSLTGIWRVSESGGLARLVIGNPTALDMRHAVSALDNATHFLVAPRGSRLATDPGNRFWVTMLGTTRSHFLAPHVSVGCTIAQWRWLVGGQGLAYVTLCTVGGTTNFRSTLYTVQLHNGRPQSIITVVSPNMTALSLTPASRCIACG
jgi:dipeptidyl aminopeptidase/acylaminoacyl peptidase